MAIDLDLHYKLEAVSEKMHKSYNFGCIVTAGISFIKYGNNLNSPEASMLNVIEKRLFAFH